MAAPEDDPLATATAPMRRILDEWRALGPKRVETLPIAQARAQPDLIEAVRSLVSKQERPPPPSRIGVTREDLSYTGPGSSQLLRVYRPDTAAPGQRRHAVPAHGGGWVFGSVDRYDASALALARKSAVRWSPPRRTARHPEHRFPSAHDDAWAAWRWLMANAGSWVATRRSSRSAASAPARISRRTSRCARVTRGCRSHCIRCSYLPDCRHRDEQLLVQCVRQGAAVRQGTRQWLLKQLVSTPQQLKDKRLNLGNNELKDLPHTTVITAEIDPVRCSRASCTRTSSTPKTYRRASRTSTACCTTSSVWTP